MDEIKRIYEENKDNPVAWGITALALLILFGGGLWPLFIMLPGLIFVYAAHNNDTGLIFPGAIITGTGLLLLYQSVTGHWASWAYAWTLYPVMVGYALRWQGTQTGNEDEIATGRNLMTYGLMVFAVMALFFEILIFSGVSLWLLLGAGVIYLWWKGKIQLGDEERDAEYRERVRQFVQEKRKNVNFDKVNVTTGGGRTVTLEQDQPEDVTDQDTEEMPSIRKPGETRNPIINPELQRRIDAALNEVQNVINDAGQAVRSDDAQPAENDNPRRVSIPVAQDDDDPEGDVPEQRPA